MVIQKIKQQLRNTHWLISLYSYILAQYYRILTRISPELNTKIRYKHQFGEPLNFDNPTTFHEKLTVLKLRKYNHNPIVKQCADKFRVRAYVEEKGLADILIPLHGVYNDPKEIDWDSLPNAFVAKWNFGSGLNLFCFDKNTLDRDAAVKQLCQWKKKDGTYLDYAEMQYRIDSKCILVEAFLKTHDGTSPADYKVYCFHGQPKVILYMEGRTNKQLICAFFDTAWRYLGPPLNSHYHSITTVPKAPETLKQMLQVASVLAGDFEFVRVDFYEINGKLYFGEMTFTPAGCLHTSHCLIDGNPMGEFIHI